METSPYICCRSSANLVVLDCGVIKCYPLEMLNEWTVGRQTPSNEQDISLTSKIASRNHGKIYCIDDKWYYVDCGSLNGTYYNSEKLLVSSRGNSDAVCLKNGDVLRIDSTNLDNPEDRGVWMLFTTESISNNWEIVSLKKDETIFGRSEECSDIIIPLSYISAKHMMISKNKGVFILSDFESKAGTYINNQAVKEKTILKEKDLIAICDCIMIFSHEKIFCNFPFHEKSFSSSESPKSHNERGMMVNKRNKVLRANIRTRKVPNNNGHGEKELIRDVKVEVDEGSLVALLGGAGSGKSTVMNCLNGMDTGGLVGTVEYKGVDLLHNFERMKSLIGSVPQQEVFHESLTVEQELTHAAKYRLPRDTTKSEIKEKVELTMRQLGIESIYNNRISKCSGGERRRVNIGIELVADRQLLCLDEPDAGLDPGNKRQLFKTLQALAHNEGKSILTIIHDVSDIDLFDKLIIMNKVDNVGRLAFTGTPNEARDFFKSDIKDIYQLMAKEPEKYIMGEANDL